MATNKNKDPLRVPLPTLRLFLIKFVRLREVDREQFVRGVPEIPLCDICYISVQRNRRWWGRWWRWRWRGLGLAALETGTENETGVISGVRRSARN